MEEKYQYVLNSIEEFKKIFGNEYDFLPVTNEDDLISFENKFNVKIPDEYRWFLLNVANGIVNKDKWGFDLVKKVDFEIFWYKEDEYNPAIPFNLDKKVVSYKYNDDPYPYEIIVNEDLDCFPEYTNGQISIVGTGCGGSDFIVVNGKEYGNIWIDNFSSMNEVYPDYDLKRNKKRLNFIDWLIMNIEHKIDLHNQTIEARKKIAIENNNNNSKKWWQFWK